MIIPKEVLEGLKLTKFVSNKNDKKHKTRKPEKRGKILTPKVEISPASLPHSPNGQLFLIYARTSDGVVGIENTKGIKKRCPFINYAGFITKCIASAKNQKTALIMGANTYKEFRAIGEFPAGCRLVVISQRVPEIPNDGNNRNDVVFINDMATLRQNIDAFMSLGGAVFIHTGPSLLGYFESMAMGEFVLETTQRSTDILFEGEVPVSFTPSRDTDHRHILFEGPSIRGVTKSPARITFNLFSITGS